MVSVMPLLAACGLATNAPGEQRDGRRQTAITASVSTPGAATSVLAPAAAPTAGPGGKLTLPTYLPIELVKPDLPPTDAGVDPAYFTFPKTLVKSVNGIPSNGGDVSVFTRVILAAPPALDANQAWQAVNKAIGANMKLNMVPTAEYNTKLATTIAGNDIPDMVFLSTLQILGIPQFLQKACADLTPYVAGDAIKDYPNLANIPPIAWKQTVYNNGIYGVPIPRPYVQGIWYINQTRFESVGAGQPKDGAEFKKILQDLTNPSAGQWGISGDTSYAFGLTGITSVPQLAMFKVPNNWKVDASGTFVKDLETDEFKAALAYTRDLWASGVFYTDALTTTSSENKTNLVAGGAFSVYPDGWFSYQGEFWDKGIKLNPAVKFRTLHPFSQDGTTPIWHQYQAFNGMTAIKQASPERIKEMLRILNYLAAPFGSEEAFLLEFGVKDVDYTFDSKGNPLQTPQGQSHNTVSWRYMAQRPQVLFDANDPEFARVAHADEETIMPVIIPDPSLGLISTTNQSKGGLLLKNFTDGLVDFVVGRRPLSEYDSLVSDWRTNGGDQMRAEFQQAYGAQA